MTTAQIIQITAMVLAFAIFAEVSFICHRNSRSISS